MFIPWQHNRNTCRSNIHGHLSFELIFWQILTVHPCLRVHICPGALDRFVYNRSAHSTETDILRTISRSARIIAVGAVGGVPSILARLTVSWCVVNPSRVWSDGWLCQLPNRRTAHGQGVAERGLVRLRRPAHTTSSQALARSSQSPSGQPCQTTFGFSTQI